MGRAARARQARREARMRQVTIQNPRTGQAETHRVSINAVQLAAWTAEREALRQAGDPDRPPDVRTGAMRAWRVRPGEPSACVAIRPDETPLVGWTTSHPRFPVVCTLLASRQADGRILVRSRVVAEGTVHSEEETWLGRKVEIGRAVRPVLARWAELGFAPPDVATAADFAEALRRLRNLPEAA